MVPQLKVGADPEMFAYSTGTGFVSVHEFFPGSKEHPFSVSHGALQVDGVAAEFNILPAEDEETWVENIQQVLQSAATYLPKGVHFTRTPSVLFRESYMKSLPDALKISGCDPDFNAWQNGLPNPPPNSSNPNRKAAGGHIHIGWGEHFDKSDLEYEETAISLIKQLDVGVGALVQVWDSDIHRREMYGKAGAFRFKPYGVEYRTPSNVWIQSEERMRAVFRATKKSFEDFFNGKKYYETYPEIVEVLNTGNRKKAKEISDAVLYA